MVLLRTILLNSRQHTLHRNSWNFQPRQVLSAQSRLPHATGLANANLYSVMAPNAKQYLAPSEARPHLRTLMVYPDLTAAPAEVGFVRPGDLELARQEIVSIANAISEFEPVWLYTKARNADIANSQVAQNVTVIPLEVDQLWIRDTGPIFVQAHDGTLAGVNTNFNYWGARFRVPGEADTTAARDILNKSQVPVIKAPLVTEGGALEFDGEGTLLATESSILNDNRNPGKRKAEIEDRMADPFGIRKAIWVKGAKGIDNTDFHIDALARFAPDNVLLLSRPNDDVLQDSEQYGAYVQARSTLQNATDARGSRFKVVEIEEAATVPRVGDEEIPIGELPCMSYVNYYLANGAVIVPVFGEERTDDRALNALKSVWSDREIVPVKLNWMAYCGGGVHCATQQWPLLKQQDM